MSRSIFGSIKRSLGFKVEQKALALSYPDIGEIFGAIPTASGVAVNAHTALKIPAVIQAVRLIAENVGSLPCKLYRDADGSKEAAKDHAGRRGAQWVSERGERPEDTARPDLIKHAYGVSELYAAPTTTRQMLEDASFDVAGWLINNAAHDFAETEGEAFLSGDGTDNTPKGLLTYETTPEKDFTRAWGKFQYVAAGHASAPTETQLSNALIKLVATLRRPSGTRCTRSRLPDWASMLRRPRPTPRSGAGGVGNRRKPPRHSQQPPTSLGCRSE